MAETENPNAPIHRYYFQVKVSKKAETLHFITNSHEKNGY